jgi:HEAT repeat protein
VQREALRAVLLAGHERAFEVVQRVLSRDDGRTDALAKALMTLKDERVAPLFSYLLPRMNRQKLPALFAAAIDALAAFGGTEAVDALKFALYDGSIWAPFRTRARRHAAADGLRRIGTEPALAVLRDAASGGPWGARSAARAVLKGSGAS